MNGDQMDALLWDGRPYPEGLAWSRVPRPQVRPGWVLIENRAAGICGSDLHYLSGAMRHQVPDDNLPAVLGHENAGVVVQVGERVKNFEPGDRVAAEPLHACYEQGLPLCPACLAGQYQICNNLGHVGIAARLRLPGGYGPYSIYHQSKLFHLPDSVSFEEAAIIDVLACGVHALRMSGASPGDVAVVQGCGAIGLDMLQCLHAAGVRDTVAVARYPFQAAAARALGAAEVICLAEQPDAPSALKQVAGLADRVYECVGGEADTVQQAIDLCRPGGAVMMLGFFTGVRPVNLSTVFLKELRIQAADGYSTWDKRREFDIALQLLVNEQVDHASLLTHRFQRQDWQEALAVAFHKGEHECIKVVFTDDSVARAGEERP